MTASPYCRNLVGYALAVCVAACISAGAHAGESSVAARVEIATGVVSVVRPDGGSSLVGVGHPLQTGQAVRTERDSTARLRFSDGTDVVLRPNSQIRIDDYQFDSARSQSDSFALRLLKGGLRTITGVIGQRNRERVSYSTTTATIGIRGTDFVMRLCEDDCASEQRVAARQRLPDAAVARLGAVSGGVSALRPDGRWRALDAGDAIYADDAIVTGTTGVAIVFFVDDTRITLQPRSILVIDEFVYDASAPRRNRVVLALLDGAARTLTGAIAKANPERFVFLTPERRIHVHGTLFDTVVQVVTTAVETAGEQAGQTAQETKDAVEKEADKAAAGAKQAAQEAAVALQNTNARISQGQQAAAGAAAKANQAANDAIANPPPVESTPTPSGGPAPKIPVPTADVDIGQAARQVGSSVVGAVRDAGGGAAADSGVSAGMDAVKAGTETAVGAIKDSAVAKGAQQAGDAAKQGVDAAAGAVKDSVVGKGAGQAGEAAKQGVDAGTSTAADVWRGTSGAVADATTVVRDSSTRVVERTVTWTGGAISTTVGAGVATGESSAVSGGQAMNYVYDAAGRVVAVGRAVAGSAVATTQDTVSTAAAATDRVLAVVIPAIIGAAKVGSEGSVGTAVRDAVGSAAAATDRALAVVIPAIIDVEKDPGGRPGTDSPSGTTLGPMPGTGDRAADRGFEAAAGMTEAARTVGGGTGAGSVAAAAGGATGGKGSTGTTTRDETGGGKIPATSPARSAPFPGEAAQSGASAVGKERTDASMRQDAGGGKALPTEPAGTSRAAADTARQASAATSAERGSPVGAAGGISITAVQVHEGAVTVVDSTGELAVRRGSLGVSTDAGPMQVRFDGVVASTAPNPASFVVDGRLFGAAAGDTPAAGLYTLVRSGRIAMTRDGREIVLEPGEAGYADDSGGAPTRLREIPRFLEDDRYLAVAFDPSTLMCGPATAGMPGVRASAVRGAAVSTAIAAAAGLPGAGTWSLPGSRTAPEDSGAYRDAVGAAHFAATRGMSATTRAAYWGGFDAGDLKSRVETAGVSTGAGMSAEGFGVRGVGPAGGSFVEPAGGFAGGNRPGRGAAAGIEDTGKWIGGQRYGGTFAAGRSGLTRSGDIAIGAGDGTSDYRGGGSGNAAIFGVPTKKGDSIDLAYMPGDARQSIIPYPDAGGSPPAKVGAGGGGATDKPSSNIGTSSGTEAGTSGAAATGIAMQDAKVKVRREREDDLGGTGAVVVLSRADAGQMASGIRRWIGAITGAAGGAGDGRTDQQTTTGGGPMIVDRGAQADAKRGSTSGGTVSFETMFRINQYVNPGPQ